MHRMFFSFAFCCLLVCLPAAAQETDQPRPYPRVGVYRTNPSEITPALAKRLAKFELIVLDYETVGVEQVRQLNPNCKILAYCNPMELFDPAYRGDNGQAAGFAQVYTGRPLQGRLYRFVRAERPQWWLNTPEGRSINYWLQPPMRLLNLSNQCPEVDGQRWSDYFAGFILDNVFNKDAVWDGLFIDNCWENISWMPEHLKAEMDLNSNGLADETNDQMDQAWVSGVANFVRTIRQAKGQDFIIIGNKPCLEHADLVNGKMWEDFPPPCHARNWDATMAHYLELSSRPGFDWSMIQTKGDDRAIRFGLTSALMGNGVYVYGQDSSRWFDFFEADLGQPLGPAVSPHQSIIKEDFQGRRLDSKLILGEGVVIGQSALALLPGQTIQTTLLEAGEYLVSFQYKLTDRRRTLLDVRQLNEQGQQVDHDLIERWPVSWAFDRWTLESAGRFEWQAVGLTAEGQSNDRPALIRRLEVVRIRPGVWTRPFENGWVFCNPSRQAEPIFPFVQQWLEPRDGRIFLKDGRCW